MNRLRSLYHRFRAAHLFDRAIAAQRDLDGLVTVEQHRINTLRQRAIIHEDRAQKLTPKRKSI